MKIGKALSISLASALLVGGIGTAFNFHTANNFAADVRANDAHLEDDFTKIFLSANIGGNTPEFTIQTYLNNETDYSYAKYKVEKAASDSRPLFEMSAADQKALEQKFKLALVSYDRPVSEDEKAEFVEPSFKTFFVLFGLLWVIPAAWYFFLARVSELSEAVRGKKNVAPK